MNKLLSIAITAAVLMLSACHIVSQEEPTQEETDAIEAYGLLTIPSSGFTKENVRTKLVLVSDEQLDLYMFDVKFATMMPVTIDMVISGVDYCKTADGIEFSGTDIVPTAGNKPYEKYIVTDLHGRVTADSMIISNNYGDIPAVYEGKIRISNL